MQRLQAPFGWIGGKSQLADDIVSMMPEHRLYVEVFVSNYTDESVKGVLF